MSDSARIQAFNRHVASGGKVEATDWMPEEYRRAVCRFVEMHANSELMGVLPEREWILRAPTLKRKLADLKKQRTVQRRARALCVLGFHCSRDARSRAEHARELQVHPLGS